MRVVSNIVQPAKELALSLADAPAEGRGRAWFDAIFREHYPRVVAMLARLTGDRGQAEEIAADAFCKLRRAMWARMRGSRLGSTASPRMQALTRYE